MKKRTRTASQNEMTLSLLYVYIRTPDLGRFFALSLHWALHGVSFIAEDMKRRQIALKQVDLVGVLFMSFYYTFLEV